MQKDMFTGPAWDRAKQVIRSETRSLYQTIPNGVRSLGSWVTQINLKKIFWPDYAGPDPANRID